MTCYSMMGCLLWISDLVLKVINKVSWVAQQIFQKTPDIAESCVLVLVFKGHTGFKQQLQNLLLVNLWTSHLTSFLNYKMRQVLIDMNLYL